jgi:hypothetical protein
MVHDPFAVPDRFDLLVSPIAQSWRECSIIARRYEAKSISISFLARHLPLYSGQHSLQGKPIPQGSSGSETAPNHRNAVEYPVWRNGAAPADEVID